MFDTTQLVPADAPETCNSDTMAKPNVVFPPRAAIYPRSAEMAYMSKMLLKCLQRLQRVY